MSSRAALRKRKKQAKLLMKQGKPLPQGKAPSNRNNNKSRHNKHNVDDDDEDDDDEDDDEDFVSDGDEDQEGEENSDDDEDLPSSKKAKYAHSIEAPKKNKTKGNQSKSTGEGFDTLFSVPPLKVDSMTHLSSTLVDILNLEDVKEITCDQKAAMLLGKLIYPTDRTLFYQLFWEQNPLHNSHASGESSSASFIGKLFPMKEFKRILKENVFVPQEDIILYGKSFEKLQSESSIDGPSVLKTFLKPDVKCGIRLLETQKWCTSMWQLASALEFEFQSRVSTEVVVQSPDFLGLEKSFVTYDFDQIVVQLEGSSGWEIGEARKQTTDHIVEEDEVDEDDDDRKYKSGIGKTSTYFLAAGDTLYIPKGRPFRQTSLHPTETNIFLVLGTNRNRAMHNLLSIVVPQAIENLVVESKRMRQALPLTLHQYIGVSVSETETEENPLGDKRRQLFLQYLEKQIMPVLTEQVLDIVDPAVDQMNKNLVMERLPIPLSTREEKSTAAGFSEATIFPYTQLRMLRPGIATIAIEDGKIVLYHCMDNARSLFGNEISPMEFELDDGPAIEMLLKAYPEPVMVSDLPHPSEDMEDKIGVAQALYKEGFLFIVDETSKPGKASDDEDESDDEDNMNSLL